MFAVTHADTIGHDWVAITHLSLSPDKTELFVQMPDLRPVNQLHLNLSLTANAIENPGETTDMFLTIHELSGPFDRWKAPEYSSKILTVHPIYADLARQMAQPPNPWAAETAAEVEWIVETGENLSYRNPHLTAQAGQTVKLTLKNSDSVPHNWVLIKPGQLAAVGDLTNRLLADPSAGQRQYVPDSEAVVCFTDIVPPGQEGTIYFTLPDEPGVYPFLCTFPGHWMVMNGTLTVIQSQRP